MPHPRGGDSFDGETTSACEQEAWVLQSHFDCVGDDIGPAGGISMETRSSRRRFIETTSVSSKSHTISSVATSWRRPVRGKGASGGEVQAEDILIDVDDDFPGFKVSLEFGT